MSRTVKTKCNGCKVTEVETEADKVDPEAPAGDGWSQMTLLGVDGPVSGGKAIRIGHIDLCPACTKAICALVRDIDPDVVTKITWSNFKGAQS